ncbi:MAG: hypothetical protein N2A40_08060 [Desulfobulbaceae bacterium]
MKMTCPHCGVVGSGHGSMPGGKVRCPQCDKVFKVMEQKIACPHCGVVGSARSSLPGSKLRCPGCEKVFLLTPGLLSAAAGKAEPLGAPSHAPARDEWVSPVSEPEMVPEPVSEVEPVEEVQPEAELELEIVIEAEPEPEAVVEVEPVVEVQLEPELEIAIEPEPEPEAVAEVEPMAEVQPAVEPEPEMEVEAVPELEAEPVPEMVAEAESVSIVAEERIAAQIKDEVKEDEELKADIMPTEVCAGCGDSFHPEFLQEVDSKLYCGICQLRSAAMGAKEQLPKFGGGKLWGTLAALVLLGLLALVLLALKKFGII